MRFDALPPPRRAMPGHVRRHAFLYLSAALHVALLAVFWHAGGARTRFVEAERQQRAIASGARLTEHARLEKRVHDMARIQSLLEQSAGAGGAPAAQPGPGKEDDVAFSAQPKAPRELLREARELSRKIDAIERDTKAEQLAKLLGIPKKKALAQLEEAAKAEAPDAQPLDGRTAAAKIEQLEARARAVLEQRRQQLEQQKNGVSVTARGAGADNKAKAAGSGGHDDNGPSGGHGPGLGQGGRLAGSAVLDRIVAFANPDLPDRASQAYALGDGRSIFGDGAGHVPDVDTGAMVKGAGRMIGPGGAYANRVYVNRWYLIGPFQGRHGAALFATAHYPPEQAVVLDAAYRGKDGRLLRWEYVDMARYPLAPPDAAEDAVYYGYTELMVDKEQDLTAWIGADDDAQLWLNDRLAWRGGDVNKQWFFERIYDTSNTFVRDYNLTEGKRVLHFRKGRNKLFFKLSNGPTRLFFSLVLTK